MSLLMRNIEVDRAKGHVPKSLLERYAEAIKQEWRALRKWFCDQDSVFCDPATKAPMALCAGLSVNTVAEEELARVLPLETFLRWHTPPPSLVNARSDEHDDWIRAETDRISLSCDPLQPLDCSTVTGTLEGLRPLFFLTSSIVLEQALLDVDTETELATRLRDALGLLYDIDTPLVAIVFDSGYFHELSIPTFIDAGDHAAFVNWEDESERLGYTWDLMVQSKGYGEVVSRRHPLRPPDPLQPSAKVFYLGRVSDYPRTVELAKVPPR